MTGHKSYHREKLNQQILTGTHCSTANKVSYSTRKLARAARNRLGAGLSVYSCGDHFHIGHHGNLTREQHQAKHS